MSRAATLAVLALTFASAPARAQSSVDALELVVGAGSASRRLSFEGDAADDVGGYHLLAALAFRAEARWFPGRHVSAHPLAGLGAFGRVRGVLVASESGQGDTRASYATTADAFAAGLAYAIDLDPVRLEVELAYGESRFRVEPSGPTTPTTSRAPFPSVRYRYLRPALGARVALPEGFSIGARAGFRGVLESGPLAYPEWFPRSSTFGLDGSLDVRWRFHPYFAVQARAAYVRWTSDLRAEAGDPVVATEALDEQTFVGADLLFLLPGAAR